VAGDEVGHAGGDAVAVAERWRGAEEGLCRLLAPARRGLGVRRDAWIRGHGFSSLPILPENRFCADFCEKNERESDGAALNKRKNRILCIHYL